MNSKERGLTTLRFQQPDKVPCGDFAIDYATVERIVGQTYVRAKARCQIAFWEGRRDEVVQSLIEE